ncbi:unnamed protein product [Schistosoma margrebowiei]|uniref:Uncharacterized protein n=1 Tax=Schistosoma margrebowiei TaxID=48269 RepID=A0A183LUP3_9TREM|nr:unnamed protein product [Schistosoma margrebowiei]
MVVGGIQRETLDIGYALHGTRQKGVPVILRELMLPDGFDPVSPSFTVGDVTTGLTGSQPTSCRTEMFSQLIDHRAVSNLMYVRSFLVHIESYRPNNNVVMSNRIVFQSL